MNNWVFNDKNAGRTQSKSRGQEKEEEGKKKKEHHWAEALDARKLAFTRSTNSSRGDLSLGKRPL